MNHRRCLVALSADTLALGLLLAGCGDYGDRDISSNAGGSTGETGSGGSSQQPGTGGSAGETGTGGNGQQGGTGGTQSGSGGSGGEQAPCSNVTPCGGEVAGTWTVTSSCLDVTGEVDLSMAGLGCLSAAITGFLQVTGTWTANSDGTYSDDTTTSGDEQIELPADCLFVSGTTTTCDRVVSALQALGHTSVDCADSASGGCSCTATIQQDGGMGLVSMFPSTSGNYTTADNVLTITADEVEYSYCVSGNTMTMTPQSTGSSGTLTGTVELEM